MGFNFWWVSFIIFQLLVVQLSVFWSSSSTMATQSRSPLLNWDHVNLGPPRGEFVGPLQKGWWRATKLGQKLEEIGGCSMWFLQFLEIELEQKQMESRNILWDIVSILWSNGLGCKVAAKLGTYIAHWLVNSWRLSSASARAKKSKLLLFDHHETAPLRSCHIGSQSPEMNKMCSGVNSVHDPIFQWDEAKHVWNDTVAASYNAKTFANSQHNFFISCSNGTVGMCQVNVLRILSWPPSFANTFDPQSHSGEQISWPPSFAEDQAAICGCRFTTHNSLVPCGARPAIFKADDQEDSPKETNKCFLKHVFLVILTEHMEFLWSLVILTDTSDNFYYENFLWLQIRWTT